MADFNQHNQFGSIRPTQSSDAEQCTRFEAMLADAVDGTLNAEDQAAFDAHLLGCDTCGASFADAQQGVTWLATLRLGAAEPASDLVDRILARTTAEASMQAGVPAGAKGAAVLEPGCSGTAVDGELTLPEVATLFSRAAAGPSAIAASGSIGGKLLPFRRRLVASLQPLRHSLLQPRLAMTAAMAFFSVAVTMNLTGVHITQMRASDLRPSSLKRSFYQANAHVVRYYDNLRVVYELESRVHDLERSAEVSRPESPLAQPEEGPRDMERKADPPQPGGNPGASPEKPVRPRPKPGTSLREPLVPHQSASALLAALDSEVVQPMQERDLA